MLSPTARQDVLKALEGYFPETFWDCQDDACDCVYQRIGMWTNPYLGETLEVRMCCIWAELYKLFPDHVRVVPAYKDGNRNEWVEGTRDWDADFDMPPAIWYRQMARRDGITVEEARKKYRDRDDERPRAVPRLTPSVVQLTNTQMIAWRAIQQEMLNLQSQLGLILEEAGCDPGRQYHVSPEGLATLEEPDGDQAS